MSPSTTPKTTSTPAAPQIAVHTWVAGDGSKQIPVAGLLADDPTLRDAVLTEAEWEHKLNAYLRSERV